MTQTLSFPELGLTFSLDRVAFHLPSFLGGRPIYWYGIIIAIAFLAAMGYIMLRTKTFGLDEDRVFEVSFVAIIAGIIGARLYYVLFSDTRYLENPIDILKVWEGGLAIYGGILFGILGIVITCKIRDVKLLPMLDLTVAAVLLGQAIGRWGNFVNIEAFGSNTSLPWGMTGPSIVDYLTRHKAQLEALGMVVNPTQPVHPTFFYESLWCFIGFIAIAVYTKNRRFDGELTLLYLAWYGLGRFFIEGLRTDSLLVGDVRVSQALALVFVIASVITLVVVGIKVRKSEDPDYLKLYVNTEESALVLAGEYYNKSDEMLEDETDGSTDDAEDKDKDLESDVPESEDTEEVPAEADNPEEVEESKQDLESLENTKESEKLESEDSEPKPEK